MKTKTQKVQKPRIVRDAATRECFLVIDGQSHPVDSADLCHTIGAGMYAGCGLVDAWPAEAWEAVLRHLDLPAAPLNRAAAQGVVRRFVQKMWTAAFEPVHDEALAARMAIRDAMACTKYLVAFGATADGRSFGLIGGRAVTKAASTAYAPTDALKAAKGLKGQAKTLLAFFRKSGFVQATTSQVAEGMVACGLKTSIKPERIAGFYLCDFAKRGWLVRRPSFS